MLKIDGQHTKPTTERKDRDMTKRATRKAKTITIAGRQFTEAGVNEMFKMMMDINRDQANKLADLLEQVKNLELELGQKGQTDE